MIKIKFTDDDLGLWLYFEFIKPNTFSNFDIIYRTENTNKDRLIEDIESTIKSLDQNYEQLEILNSQKSAILNNDYSSKVLTPNQINVLNQGEWVTNTYYVADEYPPGLDEQTFNEGYIESLREKHVDSFNKLKDKTLFTVEEISEILLDIPDDTKQKMTRFREIMKSKGKSFIEKEEDNDDDD